MARKNYNLIRALRALRALMVYKKDPKPTSKV